MEGKKTTDVEEKGRITRVEIKKPSTTTTTTTMKPSTPKRRASGVGGDAPKKWVEPDEGAGERIRLERVQMLRAFGSVMVLIVLGIIGLTYYATVGLVYGPLSEEGTEDEKKVAQTVLVDVSRDDLYDFCGLFRHRVSRTRSVPERWEPPEEDPR